MYGYAGMFWRKLKGYPLEEIMDINLSRVCEECGSKCRAYLKAHYLGIHFVEECDCGIKLSTDPHSIKWYRYSRKKQDKLNK